MAKPLHILYTNTKLDGKTLEQDGVILFHSIPKEINFCDFCLLRFEAANFQMEIDGNLVLRTAQ